MVLQEYTLHYLDEGKIEVDFVEPLSEGEFVYSQFVKHFRKYNPLIFKEKDQAIRSVICDWKHFGEYLLKLGFRKNAELMCEILTELRSFKADEYVETAWGKGLVLQENVKQPKSGKPKWTGRERIHLENIDIKKRLKNMEVN